MLNFKDYQKFTRVNTEKQLVTQLSNMAQEGQLILGEKISTSKSTEKKFLNEVVEISKSDEVISKLSNELGSPKEEETEREFVNRGKEILRKILRDTLNQKK